MGKETNKRKAKQEKRDRKEKNKIFVETVVAASREDYDRLISDLINKPHQGLDRFAEGNPTPDDWRQLQMRIAVGKEMAKLFEHVVEIDETLEGGSVTIQLIADRYNEGGRLRASPMELTLLEDCINLVDQMQENILTEVVLLGCYKAAEKAINK